MLRGNKHIHEQQSNVQTIAPTAEIIFLEDLKEHLRLTGDDCSQDNYLVDAIRSATDEIEASTGFAFLTQSWKLTLDHWPRQNEPWWSGTMVGSISELYGGASHLETIELPRYPLQSITSITVYDEDGNSTAVTVGNVFDIDTASYPGRLRLKHGSTWPIALRNLNAIEIVYVAGFGDDVSDVPQPYKRAVRTMAAWLYDNRGTGCSMGDAYVKSGAELIMRKFRRVKI